jgi:hypothetical protein
MHPFVDGDSYRQSVEFIRLHSGREITVIVLVMGLAKTLRAREREGRVVVVAVGQA